MGAEARELWKRNQIEIGNWDFSEHGSVSNAVAPGDLIRLHTALSAAILSKNISPEPLDKRLFHVLY